MILYGLQIVDYSGDALVLREPDERHDDGSDTCVVVAEIDGATVYLTAADLDGAIEYLELVRSRARVGRTR